jgi:hypothetical protein
MVCIVKPFEMIFRSASIAIVSPNELTRTVEMGRLSQIICGSKNDFLDRRSNRENRYLERRG